MKKSKSIIRLMIIAVLLTVGITIVLSVGVTFGRYQTRVDRNINFDVTSSSHMYIYEIILSPDDPDNPVTYKDFNNTSWTWTANTDDKSTSIRVANTSADGIMTANEDIAFRVRIFIPEEVINTVESGSYNLKMQANGKTYTATSDYLRSKTPLERENNSNGWVYSFADSNGDELSFLLNGGSENNVDITFILPHIVVVDENGTEQYEQIDTDNFKLLVDRIPPVTP